MKLSIIVPVYKGVAKLNKFLEQISVQTSTDYELIVVVDTLTENPLKEIDEHLSNFPLIRDKFKLVFNSKRIGRTAALNAGIELAVGEYTILMSNTDVFPKTFVASTIQIAIKHKSDIIEFKPSLKTPIKFEAGVRKIYKPSTPITDNLDIFANVYAFDFNKIYKTDVLKRGAQFNFVTTLNSRYSIEIIFRTLLVASTFSSVDKELISFRSEISENYNPLKQIRQWKSFQAFLVKNLEDKYKSEYIYNFLFTQTQFTAKVVAKAKSKVMSAKYNADMVSEVHSLSTVANPYFILKTEESKAIEEVIKNNYE